MSENSENSENSGRKNQKKSGNKRGRRRYFRRKEGENNTKRKSAPEKPKRNDESQRRARRNRRRRRGGGGGGNQEQQVAPVISAIESDYVAPASFFAYTHIVRSQDVRDSYEYRHERLTGGGRTLDDFRIDLSSLFAEDGETLRLLSVLPVTIDENDDAEDESAIDESAFDDDIVDEVGDDDPANGAA